MTVESVVVSRTAPYTMLLYISVGTLQPPYTASTRGTSVDKSIPGEGVQVVCPSLLYYHLFIIVITIVKRNCARNSTIIYFSSGVTFGYRFGSRTTAKCRQILDSFETAAGRTVCDDSEESILCKASYLIYVDHRVKLYFAYI